MLQHVVLMNVVVPALIILMRGRLPQIARPAWPAATITQLVLLWGWHAPPVLDLAMQHWPIMVMMHASLVVAAAWFWWSILAITGAACWRAMLALLITAKLFCLLGALLVFAPRLLFAMPGQGAYHEMSQADQQLAGLIMLTACPLTYVAAGIAISAHWFLGMERQAHD